MRTIQEILDYAEQKLREISKDRDLDWDQMTDEDRIEFVNTLVHEDRECSLNL